MGWPTEFEQHVKRKNCSRSMSRADIGKEAARIKKMALFFDGYQFKNKSELARYHFLKALEKQGKIKYLRYEQIAFNLGKTDKMRQSRYTPDFSYWQAAQFKNSICPYILVVEEVKGFRRRDWPIRSAAFKKQFPMIFLRTVDSEVVNTFWKEVKE